MSESLFEATESQTADYLGRLEGIIAANSNRDASWAGTRGLWPPADLIGTVREIKNVPGVPGRPDLISAAGESAGGAASSITECLGELHRLESTLGTAFDGHTAQAAERVRKVLEDNLRETLTAYDTARSIFNLHAEYLIAAQNKDRR